MSLSTVDQASHDQALMARVTAAAMIETFSNPTLGSTEFGTVLKDNPAESVRFLWPVAVEYRDAYAYAVDSNNQNPGLDPGVITDANITAAIQAHWPSDSPVG